MTDEQVCLPNSSVYSTVVPLSPDYSSKPTDCVVETPQKVSKLPAGLIPAFQMLLTRIKSGGEENVKQKEKTDAVVRKLQFGSNSRLALSTIQAYGSVEPKPNLQVLAKPLLNQQKSPGYAKRPHRSVSPVQRKKTKSAEKQKPGGGHGIRKPKPPSKSDKNKQGSHSSKSSTSSSNSLLNLKLQAIKNKFKKNRLLPAESNTESPVEVLETWGEDEEHSVPVDDIVEKLDTCPDLQDIVKQEIIKEDLFVVESEQELNKISELIHIVQGDGSKEYLPSSPTRELEELVPIEKEKIQQVESLISSLLGELHQDPNKSLNICDVLYKENGTQSLITEFSSGRSENIKSASEDEEVNRDSENSVSTSYLNQSPLSAFDSPSSISQQYLLDLENLNEKLNQSTFIDPNDTDPFEDYEDTDCSFIIECADGSVKSSESNLESQKLTDIKTWTDNTEEVKTLLQEDEDGDPSMNVSMASAISQENECNSEAPNVPSIETDADSVNSSLSYVSCAGSSNVSSSGTFISAESSPIIKLTEKISPKKLFPLFEKGKILEAKKSSSPTLQTSQRRNFPIQEKDGKEQLLLDAGQKKFGMVVCNECQFLYDPDDRKDVNAHFTHHNRHETHLKHLGWKNERVVANYGKDGYIVLVKEGDPSSWWKRVMTILETVNYDLGFAEDSKLSKSSKVFLYIWNKNIVGCIVAEHISQANRLLPGDQDLCTEEFFPATCGIVRIWTSKALRLKGYASKLMTAVVTDFLMIRTLELSEIAFSSPTPDGRAFAAKFLGTPTFLVY